MDLDGDDIVAGTQGVGRADEGGAEKVVVSGNPGIGEGVGVVKEPPTHLSAMQWSPAAWMATYPIPAGGLACPWQSCPQPMIVPSLLRAKL